MTDATRTHPMIDLSVDKLRLLQEHFPGLVLPGFVPESSGSADRAALLEGLQERGIVDVTASLDDPDWVMTSARSIVLTFLILGATDLVFESRGWDDLATVDQFAAVTSDGVAHIVQRGVGNAEPIVTVGATPLDQLWGIVMDAVPEYEVEHQAQGTATIGMVESHALVGAWQQPDRRVLDAVVSEMHIPVEAAELFRGLAEPPRRGFRLKVFTAAAGIVFAGNWVGATNGWLRMSAGVGSDPTQDITAQRLTDGGTVTAIAETREQLGSDVLGLIAGLVRGRADRAHTSTGGTTNG